MRQSRIQTTLPVVLAPFLAAATPAMADLSAFGGEKIRVDGIPAAVTQNEDGTVVVLDVTHGADRKTRVAQAIRAARDATGCGAQPVPGSIFAFQDQGDRPVFVEVKLTC